MRCRDVVSCDRPWKHGISGSIDPHFLECGVNQCCSISHFFMHKSMVGSLFMEDLSVTVVVFLRENAPNALDPVGELTAPHQSL